MFCSHSLCPEFATCCTCSPWQRQGTEAGCSPLNTCAHFFAALLCQKSHLILQPVGSGRQPVFYKGNVVLLKDAELPGVRNRAHMLTQASTRCWHLGLFKSKLSGACRCCTCLDPIPTCLSLNSLLTFTSAGHLLAFFCIHYILHISLEVLQIISISCPPTRLKLPKRRGRRP